MLNNDEIVNIIQYAFRFGEIAIRMGFISVHQLRDALEEQISNEPCIGPRPRKLIGEIFLERGIMTHSQVEMVLEEMSNNQGQPL
jgi:hypothetical protein